MEEKLLTLWKLQYRLEESQRSMHLPPVYLAFFYAEDEKDALKKRQEWLEKQKYDVVTESFEPCPHGFQLNSSSLPARIPARQD